MANSSPKLEDFLGGATMGSVTDYGQEREAMALSLDSIYYNNNNNNSNSARDQTPQHYYSGIPLHGGLYQTTPEWVHFQQQQHQISENPSSVGAPISCGELQSLTLSMSPGSQSSSCITAAPTAQQISPAAGNGEACLAMVETTKKRGPGKVSQKQTVHRKSIDTFGQRTSQYRGVTRYFLLFFYF